MPSRRRVLRALAVAPCLIVLPAAVARERDTGFQPFADLESARGGKLGVFALDTANGRSIGHRADTRFGMCSTFKLPLAAVVLREADAGRLDLDDPVPITRADLVNHAPVTAPHVGKTLSVRALAEAAQIASDNVAANLLLKKLGGPAAFTAKLRELGDTVTRLDRYETEMNRVPAGEMRDTTTPRAMAETVARLVTKGQLKPASAALLDEWMIATRTGLQRLRAGLPPDWVAGDKTGTASWQGMPNKHNDVAVIRPPGRAPVVAAVFFEAPGHFPSMRPEDDAVIADVARLLVKWLEKQ